MLKGMKRSYLLTFAWGTSVFAALVAFTAWGQSYSWQLAGLGSYQLFPLFGLIAFGLMWSHYVSSALRQYIQQDKQVLSSYFDFTSGVVLVMILVHPGLLAWQRWRDGYGLPPGSELDYLGPALRGGVILGMIALVLFLAYELKRVYQDKSWWRYIEYATDIAIVLVYIHALRLGGQLQAGWFKSVWIFYGLTLALALIYINILRVLSSKKQPAQD